MLLASNFQIENVFFPIISNYISVITTISTCTLKNASRSVQSVSGEARIDHLATVIVQMDEKITRAPWKLNDHENAEST